jgi:F0F1-type ATP synthase assembly protein I
VTFRIVRSGGSNLAQIARFQHDGLQRRQAMKVILGVLIGAVIGYLAVYYMKSGHLPF